MNNYFSHDSNARNSDKLIPVRTIHGAAGYGVYFMILERLREEPAYMSIKDYNMIAFDLRVDTSIVRSIIENFGLFVFTEDGKYFYSESFMKRMEKKDEISNKRRESGKIGVENRWKAAKMANVTKNDSKCYENSLQNVANAMENDSKERKEKERKEKSPNGDTKKNSSEFSSACSDFQKFNDWLKGEAPYCANEKNFTHQITESEFLKLKEKFTGKEIADVIQQIENRKDLRKRYVNLYLTVLNWAKREYGTK